MLLCADLLQVMRGWDPIQAMWVALTDPGEEDSGSGAGSGTRPTAGQGQLDFANRCGVEDPRPGDPIATATARPRRDRFSRLPDKVRAGVGAEGRLGKGGT